MYNKNTKKIVIGYLMVLFCLYLIAQTTIEKTIPEEIQISDISIFMVNIKAKSITVCLENGKSYYLNTNKFMIFWNNSMNQIQRNTVREFIKQLSALAAEVDVSKVTGDF